MTVQLLNENDNEPKFDSATYHIDVPENNTPPSLLRVIQTTDDDGDKLIHSCYNKGKYNCLMFQIFFTSTH